LFIYKVLNEGSVPIDTIENPVNRSNTHYRIMFRGAKGETFDHTTLFKNQSNNKLMDVINTERFTIVAQKIVTSRADKSTRGQRKHSFEANLDFAYIIPFFHF
jgi:hypothetical protein